MNDLPVMALMVGTGLEHAAVLFLALLIGHVLADFPLQGDFLATAKNRHSDTSRFFEDSTPPRGLWLSALTAHALIHAGVVWLVTGSLTLGLVELLLHWLIDYARCERWTSFNIDQALHVLCKIGYVAIISLGWI